MLFTGEASDKCHISDEWAALLATYGYKLEGKYMREGSSIIRYTSFSFELPDDDPIGYLLNIPFEDFSFLSKISYCDDLLPFTEQVYQQWHSFHLFHGFNLLGESVLFTAPMQHTTRNELPQLAEKLASHGVDSIKIAFEIEFGLQPLPGINLQKIEQLRAEIIAELEEALAGVPDQIGQGRYEAGFYRERLNNVQQFTVADLIMYDLIERDPRTSNGLELLFGRTTDGSGYYDANLSTLELKTIPLEWPEALENRTIILEALFEKAKDLGCIFLEGTTPRHQINISFWQQGKNLMEVGKDGSATGLPKGASIIEGVTKAVYEAFPVFFTKNIWDKLAKSFTINALPNRMAAVRTHHNRVELRPELNTHEEDIELMVAVAMAGALYGLEKPWEPTMKMADISQVPITTHVTEDNKLISHIIDGGTLNRNGFLQPPIAYMKRRIAETFNSLPLITPVEYNDSYLDGIIKFFSKISVVTEQETGKPIFHLPTNHKGNYAIFPSDLQSPTMIIDVPALSKKLHCGGVSEIYTVATGYNLDAEYGNARKIQGKDYPEQYSRIMRLANSEVLAATTSPEFREYMLYCLKAVKPEVFALDEELVKLRPPVRRVRKL
ncbi:MAG: hypothetical protein ACOYK8_06665 [Alphaproteobacteria bacterium]